MYMLRIAKHQYLPRKVAQHGPKSVLFLCLGKLHLSPTTEAVFRKLVTDENISENWRLGSVATATYAVGDSPDLQWQSYGKGEWYPDESSCLVGFQRL